MRQLFPWPALRSIVLCAACALMASPSHAGTPEGSVDPAARERFERGVAAYEAGRWREAVELFKAADTLAPSARLSFNIAKAYERMQDSQSALGMYRDYLRRLPEADNRDLVLTRIHELELALQALGLQQLSVLGSPAGATLLIDGQSRGITPWTGELEPGRHTLAVRLRGYQDAEQDIELPADRAIDVVIELLAVVASPEPGPDALRPLAEPEPAPPNEWLLESASESELERTPSWWTWALFGSSAGFLIGSLGFELSRRSLEHAARETPIQIEHVQKYEAMERRQITARVLLGCGAALGASAGVSLYFDLRQTAARTPLLVGCEPGGCQIRMGGRF